MAKTKFSGRSEGAPNKATRFARRISIKWRVSEGFKEVIEELAAQSTSKDSQTDILHRALLQYAYSQPSSDKLRLWITKII